MLASQFAFVLCQPGAEATLKRELARIRPAWAAAYQRPGLVTFRSAEAIAPDLALASVFARQHGMSLGVARDLDALLERLPTLPSPLCLHVIERDPDAPDDLTPEARVIAVEELLRARAGERFTATSVARAGEHVLTVVLGEQDEPLLLGLHQSAPGRCPYPGGRYPIALPPESPSRAYLKIEEAIAAFALPLRAGDTALEIGAAPGGAVYALLRRGVEVVGVDPGALDPGVLAYRGPGGARVTHLSVPVAEVAREQLPARIDWLLLDVHLAPQIALRAARRLASWHKTTLCGAVLTLKLNDWSFADRIDAFLAQAREMGLTAPEARQLASHRKELAIVGLTKRGALRV